MIPIRYVLYITSVSIVSIVDAGIITIRLETIASEKALESWENVFGGGANRDLSYVQC